jgi:hypothetical protein
MHRPSTRIAPKHAGGISASSRLVERGTSDTTGIETKNERILKGHQQRVFRKRIIQNS